MEQSELNAWWVPEHLKKKPSPGGITVNELDDDDDEVMEDRAKIGPNSSMCLPQTTQVQGHLSSECGCIH